MSDVPLRVAYVLTRFPKVSETFVAREALALRDRGVDVHIRALVRESGDVVQPEAAALSDSVVFGGGGTRAIGSAQIHWLRTDPRAYLALWWAVLRGCWRSPKFLIRSVALLPVAAAWARDLQREPVDYVHAHFATHAALAAWCVSRLTGTPFGFTAHAHDLYVEQTMLREKCDAASLVVTISEFNRRFLHDRVGVPSERVEIVRCGVDTDTFRPVARPTSGASQQPRPDALRVLCTATLEPKKGQRHLLDAVAMLSAEGCPIELTLIGDGPDRGDLEQQTRELGLAGVVRFRGALDRSGVVEALADADCFVLPSVIDAHGRMEGVPVALMEAMACGVPVVASDLSGVSELVEHERSGLLVRPGDASEIAAALRRVHVDHNLSSGCGTNGRLRVLDEFGAGRNADRLLALIERVVARTPAGPNDLAAEGESSR